MIKPNTITSEYIHSLQSIYNNISRRGILVNTDRLEQARSFINQDIQDQLTIITKIWGVHTYVGAANDDGSADSVNLNASSGSRTPLIFMRDSLKYKIPKISSRDEDGNYVSKESLGELTLQKMYALNQFNISGGDPAIRAILRIRELITIRNRYINASLYTSGSDNIFLSNYNVVGTLTGRRGSKKHVFGYGGNGQNFPKHGVLAEHYRRCLVARPGKCFLMVDQIQAEDWAVSALAENTQSLNELLTGVDRHTKLACAIFSLAEESKTEKQWKDSMERFLGKKTRHANNYDMQGTTMSDSLAKEGFSNYGPISLTPTGCQAILDRVNQIDPSIKGVFHANTRKCLDKDRTLRTPFGRERQFFGLRAGDSGGNNKIYRESYAYVPQSCIGDNTGFAVYDLENNYDGTNIIQESHDSIAQEIDFNADTIWESMQRTIRAFDRRIRFSNGFEVNIPTEGEIGLDFNHTITLKSSKTGTKKLTDISYQDLQGAIYKLKEHQEIEMKKDLAYASCAKSTSS